MRSAHEAAARNFRAAGQPRRLSPHGLLRLLRPLPFAAVVDDRLALSVDVRPLAIADAVLEAGYVDHLSPGPRSRCRSELELLLTFSIGFPNFLFRHSGLRTSRSSEVHSFRLVMMLCSLFIFEVTNCDLKFGDQS